MLYELGHHFIEMPHNAPKFSAQSRLLAWYEDRLLLNSGYPVWQADDIGFTYSNLEFVAYLDGKPYFTAQADYSAQVLESTSLRDIALINETLFTLASRAKALLEWRQQHRFCGQCGQPVAQVPNELAMFCQPCRLRFYPRISPCIIVLVTDGEKLLLAQGEKHRESGWYSTLAGFIESGESAEQAVIREVYEEVGVHVKNIRYMNSQAWPFPNQLMLGFHAEYAGGELTPQLGEIADVKWFHKDNLPKRPPNMSISGWLIQQFVSSN